MDTKRVIALIGIVLAAICVSTVLNVRSFLTQIKQNVKTSDTYNERVVFKMDADSSAGIFYKYELSSDDILLEVDHYSERHFLNIGPCYSEVWEFEIIGDGELTVNWKYYEGDELNECGDFYWIFLVADGKCSRIFDSRNADQKE